MERTRATPHGGSGDRDADRRRARPARAGFRALTLLAAGCGVAALPPGPPAGPYEPRATVLSAGDEIEVRFRHAPELNVVQVIRPDGGIALEQIGEVRAAGRSPGDLASVLEEAFGAELLDPSATVVVRSYSRRRVIVAGAVGSPGPVAMPGPLTVMEAVMLAGGPDVRTAETRSVIVIRRDDEGRYRGRRVNLRRATRGGRTTPFHLRAMDVVYVPRTRIAKINQWMDQHVNRMIPGLGLTYSKRVGDESYGVILGDGD